MEFKEFELNMLNECVELFIDTFSRETCNEKFESVEEVRNLFLNHFNNNYFLSYVVTYNNKIIGVSLGYKKPWIGGIEYFIDEFFIAYEYQGSGIGSKFLKYIDKDIKEKGINGRILFTESESPLYKFYRKNGYEELKDLLVLAK